MKGLAAPTPIDFIDVLLLLLPPAFLYLYLSFLLRFRGEKAEQDTKKMSTFFSWVGGVGERERERRLRLFVGCDTVKVTIALALTAVFTLQSSCLFAATCGTLAKPLSFLFFSF